MSRTVAIGIQDFSTLIENQYFYIDKTSFIKEWWESGDSVTLITRPRRFGKTLNMSMLEQFFSLDYAKGGKLFEGLAIWNEIKYREIQGTYPVISLSFARVKETTCEDARERICQIIRNLYIKYSYLKDSEVLVEADKAYFERILGDKINNPDLTASLYQLSEYLYRYYGKKVIILLDEYDTPMQEAYVDGYWDELVGIVRSMFNSTFKTNPCLERAVMTGITRISRESVFSDLNNLEIVTATSDKYSASFGFTEPEVFEALRECGLSGEEKKVKYWYDGFNFGKHTDIYNPWSILNFIDKGKYDTYWANTSSNSLVGKLLREGNQGIKEQFEILLRGGTIKTPIDEQIVYSQLGNDDSAVWSLLLASGYLKILGYESQEQLMYGEAVKYELTLTNFEVECMFSKMVRTWFGSAGYDYNQFVTALLQNDQDAMNEYMNRVALKTFSYFDTGNRPSGEEPERFYHGFVLGLVVDLQNRYIISSNGESGFGRYDVILEPRKRDADNAFILEFKVRNKRREAHLEDTLHAALQQIEDKQYAVRLMERGIPKEHIYSYGFAFQGKTVLIGGGQS